MKHSEQIPTQTKRSRPTLVKWINLLSAMNDRLLSITFASRLCLRPQATFIYSLYIPFFSGAFVVSPLSIELLVGRGGEERPLRAPERDEGGEPPLLLLLWALKQKEADEIARDGLRGHEKKGLNVWR